MSQPNHASRVAEPLGLIFWGFRADGDQHSGIDVISRRSEATLAVGFSKK
jgi:hypothetical protein